MDYMDYNAKIDAVDDKITATLLRLHGDRINPGDAQSMGDILYWATHLEIQNRKRRVPSPFLTSVNEMLSLSRAELAALFEATDAPRFTGYDHASILREIMPLLLETVILVRARSAAKRFDEADRALAIVHRPTDRAAA